MRSNLDETRDGPGAVPDRGRRAPASDLAPAHGQMLALQRSAGNAAVAGLVAGAAGKVAVQRALAGDPLIVAGSRGPQVAAIQSALNAAGARPALETDGKFGRGTSAAVIGFQQSRGLAPDGIVGPRTRGALAVPSVAPSTEQEAELAAGIQHAVGAQVEARGGTAAGTRSGSGGFVTPVAAGAGAGSFNPETGQGNVTGSVAVGSVAATGSASFDTQTGGVSGSGAVITSRGSGIGTGGYNATTGDVSGSGAVNANGSSAVGSGSYNVDTGAGQAQGATSTSMGSGSGGISFNTQTGDVAGAGSYSNTPIGSGTGGGSYDADTGDVAAHGSATTTVGSASGEIDTSRGTASGTVSTGYGSASINADQGTVHATVDVPGLGTVDVTAERPDWL